MYRGVAQFGMSAWFGRPYRTETDFLTELHNPLQTATLSVAQYFRNSGIYRYDHIKSHSYDIFVKHWVTKN